MATKQIQVSTYVDPSIHEWLKSLVKRGEPSISQAVARILGQAAGQAGVVPKMKPRVMGAIPPPKPVPFPWGTPVARAPAPQAKEPEWTVDWDKVRAGLPPEEDAAAEADGGSEHG